MTAGLIYNDHLPSVGQVMVMEPFSPAIMVLKAEDKFINLINNAYDGVKVLGKDDDKFVSDILRGNCLHYLKYMIGKSRALKWSHKAGDTVPTIDNICIEKKWIMSQHKGSYTPVQAWHTHNPSEISGIIYLKIPEKMNEESEKKFEDPNQSKINGFGKVNSVLSVNGTGLIEFMFGEETDLRHTSLKFRPEVGLMLIFPSWLKHCIYAFYCDGERRSMSFNATTTITK
jgi:hypothetical protein